MPLQSLLSPLSDELTQVEAVNRLIKRLRLLILSGVLWFVVLVVAFLAHFVLTDHNDPNFATLSIIIIGLLVVNLINGVFAGWTVFNVIRLLQQSQKNLTAHTQALYRRSLQMATASLVARDATIADDLETLLNHTARLITDRFGFYHTGIFLVDVNQEYAQLRAASSGEPSQALLQKDHKLKVGEEGIVGYVTATGEARIALDVADDKKHYRNPVLPKTRSEIAIPFKVYDKVIGALDVQSEDENAFTQVDVEILQSMADLLAIAITRTQLNEQVQQYADLLENRVEERTQELVASQARVQAVMDSMGEGLVYNENGETRFVNQALANMFRLNANADLQNFLFLTWQMQINTDFKDKMALIEQTINRVGIWRGECQLKRHDGSHFEAGLTVSAVRGTSKTIGSVMLIRDISQEKALQAQKNRFVANASHELRTPITNLITRLYLLRRQPERSDEHLKILEHVANRMRYLVDNLLDMARFERGKIELNHEKVNLQHLIQSVVRVQQAEAESKQLMLKAVYPEEAITLMADGSRLEQVLTNLVTNAVNYTPEGGKVTVRLSDDADRIRIAVVDTGIGIAPEHQKNLFQPFYRVDDATSQGTGLGLSISKMIVELHGGTLQVDSTLNQGTTFTIALRRVAAPA